MDTFPQSNDMDVFPPDGGIPRSGGDVPGCCRTSGPERTQGAPRHPLHNQLPPLLLLLLLPPRLPQTLPPRLPLPQLLHPPLPRQRKIRVSPSP